jgi:TetR/AcrR family transcriptional regulator of autoinduction and epiphytic fitness
MSTDGRTARALRTRDAVVEALEGLIVEGESELGARRIAQRAGVSTRSVFAHFTTLEDLHRVLADRVRDRVLALLHPIDPGAPLPARIADLCAQRGRVSEDIGPFRRLATARLAGSPALAAARDEGRRASRDQIERVFAAELTPLGDTDRARRIAAVDALVSGETWDLLRTTHGMSPDDATGTIRDAATAVLTAADRQATDRPAIDRRVEAEIVVADAEARVARLLAAIEAGASADLVAPRLAELDAVRAAARRELSADEPSPRSGGPPPTRSH